MRNVRSSTVVETESFQDVSYVAFLAKLDLPLSCCDFYSQKCLDICRDCNFEAILDASYDCVQMINVTSAD